VAAVAGEIVFDYDPSLETQVGPDVKIEEMVGLLFINPQSKESSNTSEFGEEAGVTDARTLLGTESLDFAEIEKRQSGCPLGYWYCSS
jgi:hypothetical protein